jgi:hypothetical protein
MAQRMMPPKMLPECRFTLGLRSMILNPSVTFSMVSPPPTRVEKFAPARHRTAVVVHGRVASPAPLTRRPILPSSEIYEGRASRRLDLGRILLVLVAHGDDVGWRKSAFESKLSFASVRSRAHRP